MNVPRDGNQVTTTRHLCRSGENTGEKSRVLNAGSAQCGIEWCEPADEDGREYVERTPQTGALLTLH